MNVHVTNYPASTNLDLTLAAHRVDPTTGWLEWVGFFLELDGHPRDRSFSPGRLKAKSEALRGVILSSVRSGAISQR